MTARETHPLLRGGTDFLGSRLSDCEPGDTTETRSLPLPVLIYLCFFEDSVFGIDIDRSRHFVQFRS
jgi:hypothetical protein